MVIVPKNITRYLPIVITAIIAVLIFGVYLATLAPTITWHNGGTDSGELAAAVSGLGIAHPPGYPAYVLVGYLWASLPLGGDTAYRLNLFSAVSATVTGWLTMYLIFQLSSVYFEFNLERIIGAIFGSVLLMLAPLVWSQAIITEVYIPGLMMVTLAAFVFLRKRQLSSIENAVGGGLIGFGMGILPQVVLLLLAAMTLLFFSHRKKTYRFILKRAVFLFAGFVAGATVFLFLPLRAAMHPVANWGNPVTMTHFWVLVSARQYHHLVLQPTFSAWIFRLGQSVALMGQQLSWGGMLFAGWGIFRLWRDVQDATVFLLVLLGSTLLFRAGYPVEGNAVYLIPSFWVLAIFAGYGLMTGMTTIREYAGTASFVVGVLLLVLLVWRGMATFPIVNVHSDWQAYRFGQQIFTELPIDAVVITDRDETTFSLWYLQSQGQRRDVIVIDNRLLFYDWYVQNLMVYAPSLRLATLQPNKIEIFDRPLLFLSTPAKISIDSFSYSFERY